MADVEIKGKVSIDTGSGAKSMNELNKSISDAKKAMNEAKIGSDEYKLAQIQLKQAQDNLKKTTDEANGTHNKSGEAFGVLKGKVQSVIPGFQGASDGVKGLGAELRILAMNPVMLILTAIVAVLALMYAAFKNSFEGGQKLEQVFAGIKAAGQALFDNLEKIGSAIVKVFSFDFSGAMDDIKGVAKAAGDAYSAMAKLTQRSQELHKEQLANDLDAATRAAKLADLKEKANDDSIPAAQRKKAAQALYEESLQNSKDDLKLAKETAENKIAMLTLQKDGARKNQDEIVKIQIEQINGARENSNELRAIGKLVTKAERDEEGERKLVSQAAVARHKEAVAAAKQAAAELKAIQDKSIQDARTQAQTDNKNAQARIADQIEKNKQEAFIASTKISIHTATNAALIASTQTTEAQLLEIQKNANAEKLADEKLLQEQRATLASEAAGALNTLADVVGKQTLAGKLMAGAAALINTFQGISKGVAMGMPWGIPSIVAATATGFAAVRNIAKTKIPGQSGTSVSAPSASSVIAPLVPQAVTTNLNQSSINAVGNAAQGGVNRSYITDSDYTNANERNLRLSRAARL